MKDTQPTPIEIAQLPIRLGQFLKLANLVQDGLEAKFEILEGRVLVNGQQETRRGRKLVHGDLIVFAETTYRVTLQDSP